MSYCNRVYTLGEFVIPAKRFGKTLTNWVPGIQYIPRPPVAVPGAMNPWQVERQRVLWTAEEAAWKKIKALKVRHADALNRLQVAVNEFNHHIQRLEGATGKKSPLSDATGYGALLYSVAGGPYAWAVSVLKFGFDFLMSSSKKKKIEAIVKRIEELQLLITQIQSEIRSIESAIQRQIGVTQSVQSAQTALQSEAVTLHAERASVRDEMDAMRGRARLLAARQLPPKLLPSPYAMEDL